MEGNESNFLTLRRLKSLTHQVDQGKVVSKGEGSGEIVDVTLVSNTFTLSRTFILVDSGRTWGLL